MTEEKSFSDLIGKTIAKVEGAIAGSERITLTLDSGERVELFHDQACCEDVQVSESVDCVWKEK